MKQRHVGLEKSVELALFATTDPNCVFQQSIYALLKTHLVLSALGVERQDGQVGPVGVPVEGHVGRAGRDEVAMGAVAADRLKEGRVLGLEVLVCHQ